MRRYVLGNTQSEYLFINYMSFDSIFYLHNVVGGGVQMYKRHIWRHPSRAQKRNHRFLFRTVGHRKYIVVPYVTTYAIPLRTRAHAYTIIKTKTLL